VSEYQYYEFRAVDRPLSQADQGALRKLSTRARITARSFTNSYDWGDFRGDPADLMRRWFDLHLYLANWGSRRLMMRLPKRLVRRQAFDCVLKLDAGVELKAAGDSLILDISREEMETDDYWDIDEDDSAWLPTLAPLRADLLGGDLRLVYLLWLMALETDAIDTSEPEPLPGLGPMTGALETFNNFFQIDPILAEAAAERPFATVKTASDLPRRTAGAIVARAEAIREGRQRKAAEAEAARLRKVAADEERSRRKHLDALRRRGVAAWREVETEINRRNPAGYTNAHRLLQDLKVVAELNRASADFDNQLRSIRERHARKEQFIKRLKELG
jgi:hypothetical protein